jgi:hypothetical protein
MPTGKWIRIVILVATAIAAAIVWVTSRQVDLPYIRALVTAASVVTIGVFIYDSWAWRWPAIKRLTSRPDVHGTWKSELRSSHESVAGTAIECYVVVQQTYSRIVVRMLFERSASRSMSGDIVFEDGACRLYYVFAKQTRALDLDGNPSSRGGAVLTVARSPATHLEGDYWTDALTLGELKTVGRCKQVHDTFDGARSATYV